MLPILINATVIWLLSLLVYELALKQTTFHRLNRGFLLLSFLAGVVLPLLPWTGGVEIRELAGPAADAVLPASSGPASGNPGTSSGFRENLAWLPALYLAGAAVATGALLLELARIRELYRRASRSREGRWIIAETGAAHGPFSFLNIIFVSSRQDYSEAEWDMLRTHEQLHFRCAHAADLILLQAAAVVLWFHPLVHVYRLRLRLIHEYEVDSLLGCDTLAYGSFLLEQAACRPMAITHALNYSPLKNRIHMMTRPSSSRRAQARFLLLLPLLSCAVWCCTKAQSKVGVDVKDRHAMRRDAQLVFESERPADTIEIVDAVSGNTQQMVMAIVPKPERLNGQQILTREALSRPPVCRNPGAGFGMRYLIGESGLTPVLEKMPDGEYFMAVSDLIVDQNGRVAYYMLTFPENHGALTPGPGGVNLAKPNGLSEADKGDIQRRLAATLIGGDLAFTAATDAGGKAVPYFLDAERADPSYRLSSRFRIRAHKLSYFE